MQKYCSEECQAEAKRLRKKRQQDLINGIEPIMDLQHQAYLTFSKAAILMDAPDSISTNLWLMAS